MKNRARGTFPTRAWPYALAVGAPTVVVLLMLPVATAAILTPPFLGAILLVAWVGGFGPAAVTTLLSAAALEHFFLSRSSAVGGGFANWPWLLMFLLVSLVIAKLVANHRMAEARRELLLLREQRARAEADRTRGEAETARAEAEAANRAKDDFLALLSHELRTPLTAMLGWTRVLRIGNLEPDKQRQALEIIERNVRVQVRLIDDLLDVSRIVTGKLQFDLVPVDLVTIIETVLESARPSAEAKRIELRGEFDAGAALVRGDPWRLQQVVSNLVSNGIKFTPQGGRVEVRLERTGGRSRIVVQDTGAGIDPELLPRVFDRFQQADTSSTRFHGGLGLGLAIVRHLVEVHGGTVDASSGGAGQGATFTVMLPSMLREEPPAGSRVGAVAKEPGERLPALHGLRVLVVEDETDAGQFLATTLARCKADVKVVLTVDDAARAVETARPDLLISDIMMPGTDGYALISRLRAWETEHGGHLPAIAVTGCAGSEDRSRARTAGFDAYLAKPVDPVDLAQTVVEVMAGRTGA